MPPRRSSRAPTPTKKLKFTLPGPMTIVDTVADRYLRRPASKLAFAFAELLNQEALALEADGVDIDRSSTSRPSTSTWTTCRPGASRRCIERCRQA